MTSAYGRIALICNQRAGGGKAGRVLPEVRRHLDERGLDHDVYLTSGPRHATELARAALASGGRFIVAVGGDGTVHEVVNGMIENDEAVAAGAVLGVVGCGTACDFVRTFGIPAMPGHAVAHLDGAQSFPIDVGKVTLRDPGGNEQVRYFANIAEAGMGADVAARVARLPSWLGPTIYLVAFWMTILRNREARVEVDLVDRSYVGEMRNLVVANGQFFAGGMKIAPRAAPTDGLLDVQIQNPSKSEAIAALPRAYRGEHVPHPDIKEAKRVRVSVTADRPLPVEADGELLGHTPATFEVVRDALRLKV